jgi:hypothetical protein
VCNLNSTLHYILLLLSYHKSPFLINTSPTACFNHEGTHLGKVIKRAVKDSDMSTNGIRNVLTGCSRSASQLLPSIHSFLHAVSYTSPPVSYGSNETTKEAVHNPVPLYTGTSLSSTANPLSEGKWCSIWVKYKFTSKAGVRFLYRNSIKIPEFRKV